MSDLNYAWAKLIIEELVRLRIERFVLSPGARCTPLTVAVAKNRRAKSLLHYDERGAAFFALGYARVKNVPTVLICTSGSAVANYFPAIVEASQDHIPLLLLTADRPPELLDSGANQSIEQYRFFGDYTRAFFQLPCPDKSIQPEYVLSTIDQAVYRCLASVPGPVQVNCHFREPLLQQGQEDALRSYLSPVISWEKSIKPYTSYSQSFSSLSKEALCSLAKIFQEASNGIVLLGRLRSCEERGELLSFLKLLSWPVFADIISGMRLSHHCLEVVPYYDQLLVCSEDFPRPDVVLHFGGQMTSKRLLNFLKKVRPKNYVVVKGHPFRHDPEHIVTERIEADIVTFCRSISPFIERKTNKHIYLLQKKSSLIESVIEERSEKEFGEIALVRSLAKEIPEKHGLFLASSLAIRHMDMFTSPLKQLRIEANRGVSGIDGIIAAATGFALALGAPVTLLIGDLAFLHDLNSLALLNQAKEALTIIVVNNNGGGIFNHLPIADDEEVFETFFKTPHHMSFSAAAELFSLDYKRVEGRESFLQGYEQALCSGNHFILEVFSNSDCNALQHKSIQSGIRECLKVESL